MAEPFDEPIVDFRHFIYGKAEDRQAVVPEVGDALWSNGFFYLSGHGIEQAKIDEAFAWSKRFFHLPKEQKQSIVEYMLPGNETIRGHISSKEGFGVGNPAIHPPDNHWPFEEALPGFREFMESFWKDCAQLLHPLFECLTIALRLDESNAFSKFHATSRFRLNLLHYPASEAGIYTGPRMAAHSDTSTLTLMFQETTAGDSTDGLEIGDRSTVSSSTTAATFTKRGGVFRAAKPIEGTVLVSAGHALNLWAPLRWVSAIHRVAGPTRQQCREGRTAPERFSIPTFAYPDRGTIIEPLPGEWRSDAPKRLEPLDFDAYLEKKNAETTVQRSV
ncbi:MAG: hypothetical protein M1820_009644 [Bogoriella megaspora]|nr:MAG: hypothetical protein M1820_009644 [Bogoriella megaspora]